MQPKRRIEEGFDSREYHREIGWQTASDDRMHGQAFNRRQPKTRRHVADDFCRITSHRLEHLVYEGFGRWYDGQPVAPLLSKKMLNRRPGIWQAYAFDHSGGPLHDEGQARPV